MSDSARERGGAFVVETGAVDERVILRESKQTRPRISRLRMQRDGARFDEAETECGESLKRDAVFVEAGCKSDRVGEGDPEPIDSGLVFKTYNSSANNFGDD